MELKTALNGGNYRLFVSIIRNWAILVVWALRQFARIMYYFINRVVTMRTPCSPFTVSSKTTAFFSVVFKSKEYLHNIPDNNKNKQQFYLRSTPVNTENCEPSKVPRNHRKWKCVHRLPVSPSLITFQFPSLVVLLPGVVQERVFMSCMSDIWHLKGLREIIFAYIIFANYKKLLRGFRENYLNSRKLVPLRNTDSTEWCSSFLALKNMC